MIPIWEDCTAAQGCKLKDRHTCEKLLAGLVLLVGIEFLTVCWWLIEPASPPTISLIQQVVDINGQPKLNWRAGETLYIRSAQEIIRDGPRTATQFVFDEDHKVVAVRFATLISPGTKRGKVDRSFAVPLPATLTLGNYTHRVEIGYALNWLRPTEVYELPAAPFVIVP